ncbi:MAG TPA: hypothetical protein PLI77_07320, partial [Bacteroidales bacterium]|nr:hypothetical protein [Bacteroidales bacterium]
MYWILTAITIFLSGFIEFSLVESDIKFCMGDYNIAKYFHLIPITTRNAGFMLVFIIIRYYKESV